MSDQASKLAELSDAGATLVDLRLECLKLAVAAKSLVPLVDAETFVGFVLANPGTDDA